MPSAKRRYMEVEVTVSEEMGQEEILDRIETELSYRGDQNLYEVIVTGRIDPELSPDFERLSDHYFISDFRMEVTSRWDYEQISREDDLLMQKVAGLLKDEPKALSYAVKALMASKE